MCSSDLQLDEDFFSLIPQARKKWLVRFQQHDGVVVDMALLGNTSSAAHQNRISVAHPENGGMRHRTLATKIYFCGASLRCAIEIPRFCGALATVHHRIILMYFQFSAACCTNTGILQKIQVCYRKYRYITGNRKYMYIL